MKNFVPSHLKSSTVCLLLAASFLVAPTALAQGAATTPSAPAQPKADATPSTAPSDAQSAKPGSEEGVSAAAPTEAAPTEEEREAARVAFEEGSKAFEEGNYPVAVEAYKKAYALIPSPHAEYWVAKSLDLADAKSETPAETLAAYTKLLTNPGASHVGAEKVAEAQERVETLKKLVPAKVKLVSTPEGATVTVDGVEQTQKAPLEVSLTHGPHKIEISYPGYGTMAMDFAAEGGSTVEQQIQLTPLPVVAPVAAPPPEEEPEEKSIVPAVVTLGLGGVGLITGTVFGILALNSKAKFNDSPSTAHADAAERNALIADMSFGIALTLGITGIVLLTADDEDAAPTAKTKARTLAAKSKQNLAQTRVAVAPYGHPTGAGAAAHVRF